MLKSYLLLGALVATAGCLKNTTFNCKENADCDGAGNGAMCEADGLCSVFDSSCAESMRRYADNSGSLSNTCVGGGTPVDAPPDMNTGNEMPIPMGCPADFMMLPNSGPRNHRYKLIDMNLSWVAHRDGCAALGTYLAFPDGDALADAEAELMALRTLAGDTAWVGINDQLNEGQYRTSTNMPVSATTAMLLNIGGNQGEKNAQDCLIIDNNTIDDALCADTRKAVCECVP